LASHTKPGIERHVMPRGIPRAKAQDAAGAAVQTARKTAAPKPLARPAAASKVPAASAVYDVAFTLPGPGGDVPVTALKRCCASPGFNMPPSMRQADGTVTQIIRCCTCSSVVAGLKFTVSV
jgi:hypothetical protein